MTLMVVSPSTGKSPQRTRPVVSTPKLPKAIKLAAGLLGLLLKKSTAPRKLRSALAGSVSAPVTAANVRRYFIDFIILRVDLVLLVNKQSSGQIDRKFFQGIRIYGLNTFESFVCVN